MREKWSKLMPKLPHRDIAERVARTGLAVVGRGCATPHHRCNSGVVEVCHGPGGLDLGNIDAAVAL